MLASVRWLLGSSEELSASLLDVNADSKSVAEFQRKLEEELAKSQRALRAVAAELGIDVDAFLGPADGAAGADGVGG